MLAANGDALTIDAGLAHSPGWNTGTGRKGGDILAGGSSVLAEPVATLCQTLEQAQPWSLIAVPLRAAVQP